MPLRLLILSDVLLSLGVLFIFCYFHHIRMLWSQSINVATEIIQKEEFVPPEEDIPAVTSPYTIDFSGDFGMRFPTIFLQDEQSLRLDDDAAIRAYGKENGILLSEDTKTKYVGLYRSHDIFVCVSQTDTYLYNDSANKNYRAQYFYYDIYVRNIDNFYTVASENRKTFKNLMDIGSTQHGGGEVVAAVNGDYMGNTNHVLASVRNGSVYRAPQLTESDICVLYYNGVLANYNPAQYDKQAIMDNKPYQIWNFGPSLLDSQGKAISSYNTRSYDTGVVEQRNPRTAIGYFEPGHYFFLSVDGRSSDSDGVNMRTLATLCESFGAQAAYNMDGGDSAQAYFFDTVLRDDAERHTQGDSQRNLWDIILIGECL